MKETAGGSAHAWMALASMCVMTIVWIGVGWNTMTLYADPIVSEWGVGRTQFMLCVTLISGGNTVVSLFAYGQLEARFGIRKLLLASGCLSTAAFALMAAAQNLAMLYVGAALFGIGVAFQSNNTFMTVVNHWFKKRQGTMTGIATTAGSVSGIVFAMVMAAVIAEFGWRMGFAVTAVMSVVATVVTTLLYKGSPNELGELPLYADGSTVETGEAGAGTRLDEASSGSAVAAVQEDGIGYAAMFKTMQFWLMVVAFLLGGIVCYAAFSNLAMFTVDLGYGEYAGTVLSVTLAATAVGMIPGGIIVDKLGAKWMIALCCLLLMGGMFILTRQNIALPLVFVAGILLGLGYDICQVPAGAAVMSAFGQKEYSKKLGTCAGFLFLGVSLAPVVMSAFYDVTGSYGTALAVLMAAAAATAALIFPATRRAKEK